MLLPKSQSDQRNGEPQKPGAQRREESARRASPRAAAKPSGRQQLMVATELKTAPNDAEMPVACFMVGPLFWRQPPRDVPDPPWEDQSRVIPDKVGS